MKKDLLQEKEELLKESKAKLNTMDNIKTQIEILVKVCKIPTRLLHTHPADRLLLMCKRK
jgi:hypothetical protein